MQAQVRKGLGLLALALLAFSLTSAGIRSLVPWPNKFFIRDKLQYFADHRDDYAIVFIGSSTTDLSFRPRVIDPLLEDAGHHLRSFNLGAGGMDAFAMDALLQDVLALKPKNLRWVVLEFAPWTVAATESDSSTRRVVRWHRPDITAKALQVLALPSKASLRSRLFSAAHHLRLFARWWGNFGELPDLMNEYLGKPQRLSFTELANEGGFRLAQKYAGRVAKAQALFQERPTSYLKNVAALRRKPALDLQLDNYFVEGHLDQFERIRAAGAQPLWVIPPDTLPRPLAFELAKRGDCPPLLAFNDPDAYPDLYAVAARIDARHLDRAGASRFSELFAAELLKLLSEE